MSDPAPPDVADSPTFAAIMRELDLRARFHYEAVQNLPCNGFDVAVKLELHIARSLMRLHRTLTKIRDLANCSPTRLIPRTVEREINNLESTLKAQIKRWGWSFLLRPDAEAQLARKLESHHKRREIPFLRAILAWRSLPNLESHIKADRAADTAEKMGLKPLRSAGRDPEEFAWELHRAWRDSPALSRALPTSNEQENTILARASDRIRSYVYWNLSDLDQTDESHVTPDVPCESASPPYAALEVLTPSQRYILEAMFNAKSFNAVALLSTDEIARKSGAGQGSGENLKQPMSDLRQLGLVDSRRGRNGGYFLTENGRAVCEQIASSKR